MNASTVHYFLHLIFPGVIAGYFTVRNRKKLPREYAHYYACGYRPSGRSCQASNSNCILLVSGFFYSQLIPTLLFLLVKFCIGK